MLPVSFGPLRVKIGFDLDAEFLPRLPGPDGIHRIEIPEVNRLEIDLADDGPDTAALRQDLARCDGHLIVGGKLRPLPVGSTLDRRTGRFSWMPGPGFLGSYDLVFIMATASRESIVNRIRITVIPKR